MEPTQRLIFSTALWQRDLETTVGVLADNDQAQIVEFSFWKDKYMVGIVRKDAIWKMAAIRKSTLKEQDLLVQKRWAIF